MQLIRTIGKLDIYEGDILQLRSPYRSRVFTGPVDRFGSRFRCMGFFFSHYDNPDDIFSEETHLIKVIGNIHENPELLK